MMLRIANEVSRCMFLHGIPVREVYDPVQLTNNILFVKQAERAHASEKEWRRRNRRRSYIKIMSERMRAKKRVEEGKTDDDHKIRLSSCRVGGGKRFARTRV